jgi:hypothetical protein
MREFLKQVWVCFDRFCIALGSILRVEGRVVLTAYRIWQYDRYCPNNTGKNRDDLGVAILKALPFLDDHPYYFWSDITNLSSHSLGKYQVKARGTIDPVVVIGRADTLYGCIMDAARQIDEITKKEMGDYA